jgi:glycosyltransferase involved in cell wall biosynthesis
VKILFLSRWFPYPPNNGSKLRIYNLLRGLAKEHDVTLLSFADRPDLDPGASELRSICEEVFVVPWKPYNPSSLRARLGYLSLTPRSVVDTFSPDMEQYLKKSLSTRHYDLVIASQSSIAHYVKSFKHLPALLEEVEVGVLYEQFAHANSNWQRLRYGLTWMKHNHYLVRTLRDFRACTVVSEQERDLISRMTVRNYPVEVIPNCINLTDYQEVDETPQPNTLIFTGSFQYLPNYRAMNWFLSEIYPQIKSEVLDVSLTITGDHADLPLPEDSDVNLTGYVDDVQSLIARSWISIAPILSGGGTRLKILEAMALGTPVVATTKGVEGIEVRSGEHVLVADTPQAFVESIILLLKEPGLRNRLVENAFQLVRKKYDWAVVMPKFLDLAETIAHC